MSSELKVTVADARQSAQGFLDAWHAAEQGLSPAVAEQRLVFEDLETLLHALTPARWHLLRVLRGVGASSVRALARRLGRDYKNVHQDVATLERLGLVTRTATEEIEVPWSSIVAELRLAA